MRFAIAATGDKISGPGEATEIIIYNLEKNASLEEIYENPALTATSARGISMLKSVIDKGVEALVISGIGEHAFNYASGRLNLLNGRGMTTDEAVQKISKDGMKPIKSATHGMHH